MKPRNASQTVLDAEILPEGAAKPATEESPHDAATQESTARHTLRNSLYSILLHVHCAEASVAQGDMVKVPQNLANIRKAVLQSQEIVNQLSRQQQD